jgi:hypothetical protein
MSLFENAQTIFDHVGQSEHPATESYYTELGTVLAHQADFHTELAKVPNVQSAFDGLNSAVTAIETELKPGGVLCETVEGVTKAIKGQEANYAKKQGELRKAVAERKSFALGATKVGGEQAPKELSAAFRKAEAATNGLANKVKGWAGLVQVHGVNTALKKNWTEMKVWEKPTGVGFARIGGVGVGGVMALDGILRSKTQNGEDRSMLVRLGEVVVGGGVGTVAALAGRAI